MSTAEMPDPAPLLELGLTVFPIPAGTKLRPADWQTVFITEPGSLPGRWKAGDNIGVACRPSNLVVLDLDIKDGVSGADVLAHAAARARRTVPATFTVATQSGGQHLYFHAPAGAAIPSSSGGVTALGPAIDVRAPGLRLGSYVVGPGSVVNERCYSIIDDHPIQILPAWITAILIGEPAHAR